MKYIKPAITDSLLKGTVCFFPCLGICYSLDLECPLEWNVERGHSGCAIKGDCRTLPLLSFLHPGCAVNGPCPLMYSEHQRPQTEAYSVMN